MGRSALPRIHRELEQAQAERIKVLHHKERVIAETKTQRLEYALKC